MSYGYLSLSFLGPSHWKDLRGNEACGGKKQSPVNIENSEAVSNENLTEFTFTGYDTKPDSMLLRNNGHTGINTFALVINSDLCNIFCTLSKIWLEILRL